MIKKLFKKSKPVINMEEAVRDQVVAHQRAVLAGVSHMLRTISDKEDPGVALIASVVTKSGEIIHFMHGALTFETAPTAAALLHGNVLVHTLAKRGKTSPLTTAYAGEKFVGGNAEYNKGVEK